MHMTLCTLVNIDRRFGEACCVYRQSQRRGRKY